MWGPQTELALGSLPLTGRTLGEARGLCASLGAVKASAARANADAGVLPSATAAAVASAADRLATPDLLAHLVVDPRAGGGGIAVHHNVNEVLASVAGCTPGEVGASQSTADVCHSAARLAVADALDRLDDGLAELEGALGTAASRFGEVPTLARTCLQDALAVPASLLPAGGAAAIARRRAVLRSAASPLTQVVLGSTVVGTGAGATASYRAAVMGHLARAAGRSLVPHPNPASALQHGDDLLDVSSAAVAAALVVAKVAQDLRLLSSGPTGGLGEVRLPRVMEGSSFFVDKNNPVVAETAISAAALVAGSDATARAGVARAELHLAGYDLAVAMSVLDALEVLATAASSLASHCVVAMELDEPRCRSLAASATAHKEPPTP